MPSVSYAIGVAAANLELEGGDEILMLAEQFPSNVYPWHTLAHQRGAIVRSVARPADGDWTSALLPAIGAQTRIAALPHAHWTDGTCLDLERIGRRCREAGCALVLDLTQSLGAVPFSVASVRPDFMVAAAYKWLLGPYGVSYLYVAPEHQQGEPLEQTWMGRAGSENFAGLVDYRDTYRPGARRFDAGEHSNFALLPMALAALQQIAAWTPQEISASLSQTTALVARRADELGFNIPSVGACSPHMLGLGYPGPLPTGLVEALEDARVYVSIRGSRIRVAPHLHVTEADIERFFAVLSRYAP